MGCLDKPECSHMLPPVVAKYLTLLLLLRITQNALLLGAFPAIFISPEDLSKCIYVLCNPNCDQCPTRKAWICLLTSIQLHPGFFITPLCLIVFLILPMSSHLLPAA